MVIIGRSQVIGFLKPGDVLLYDGPGLVGSIIKMKTYADVSHSETYLGNGQSAAARGPLKDQQTGKTGVDTYPFRFDGLAYVLRPKGQVHFYQGLSWHNTTIGQRYDWLGLLSGFFTSRGTGDERRQFCSEHTTRFAKKAGVEVFPDAYDSDKTSPGDLKKSNAFRTVLKRIPARDDIFYGLA